MGLSNLQFSQANMEGLSGSQEFKQPPQYSFSTSQNSGGMNTSHPTSPTTSQQSPSSPQQPQQQQHQQQQQSSSLPAGQMTPEQLAMLLQQSSQQQQQQLQQGKIPDIIFTGTFSINFKGIIMLSHHYVLPSLASIKALIRGNATHYATKNASLCFHRISRFIHL